MMDIDINWAAVLAATVVSMILGAVWYHESVFGKKWMKAVGLTKKQAEEGATKPMIFAAVRAFIMAFVMFHFIYIVNEFHTGNSWLRNSLVTAVWAGLGFSWVTMKMHYLFEQKSRDAMAINVGFEVVDFVLVGLAIGLIAG